MDQPKKRQFTCPQCSHAQEFSVRESVNVNAEPQLKVQVLRRELGRFTCGHCARPVWVSHPIHYHDPERKLMIWFPNGEARKPPLDEGSVVMNLLFNRGYSCRLVNSYNELIEKIRIFDDGQDDRALEALKLAFTARQAPADQKLFYDGTVGKEGGQKAVRLSVVKKKGKTVQEVPFEELRRQAAVVLRVLTAEDEKGKWLCVDANYASKLLERAGG
jgi:hypothetical protein